MGGLIKLATMLFVLVAFFGLLIHPGFISSSTTGVTSVIKQVQAG